MRCKICGTQTRFSEATGMNFHDTGDVNIDTIAREVEESDNE